MFDKVMVYLATTAVFAVIAAAVLLLIYRLAGLHADIPSLLIGGFFGKMVYDLILKAIKKIKNR
jgi:uncharacterized membrane protein